jgi:hypothetical protein
MWRAGHRAARSVGSQTATRAILSQERYHSAMSSAALVGLVMACAAAELAREPPWLAESATGQGLRLADHHVIHVHFDPARHRVGAMGPRQ